MSPSPLFSCSSIVYDDRSPVPSNGVACSLEAQMSLALFSKTLSPSTKQAEKIGSEETSLPIRYVYVTKGNKTVADTREVVHIGGT